MKLRLQTDYALRTLLFLGHVDRQATAEEMAQVFGISKDHLVKAIQALARSGFVRSRSGRGGGVALARSADAIRIQDVVAEMEGRHGLLECVESPEVCVLEPGCGLRRKLIEAEAAFYDSLGSTTVGELSRSRRRGGLHNLSV